MDVRSTSDRRPTGIRSGVRDGVGVGVRVDPGTRTAVGDLHPWVEPSATVYPVDVFGRTKTPAQQPTATESTLKAGGKGRPTPSRREAEARNRRPIVGAAPLKANATKEEKKAARAAQRQAMSVERGKAREAMITGDEKHLPGRDQGPARRWARGYVHARWNIGELLLPAVLVILVIGFIPVAAVRIVSPFLLYALLVAVIIDAFLLRRRVQKLATAKFGDKPGVAGVGGYAMMRALQMRRTRLPRPQVKRGEFPS
jgi:hypothetical protein